MATGWGISYWYSAVSKKINSEIHRNYECIEYNLTNWFKGEVEQINMDIDVNACFCACKFWPMLSLHVYVNIYLYHIYFEPICLFVLYTQMMMMYISIDFAVFLLTAEYQ